MTLRNKKIIIVLVFIALMLNLASLVYRFGGIAQCEKFVDVEQKIEDFRGTKSIIYEVLDIKGTRYTYVCRGGSCHGGAFNLEHQDKYYCINDSIPRLVSISDVRCALLSVGLMFIAFVAIAISTTIERLRSVKNN